MAKRNRRNAPEDDAPKHPINRKAIGEFWFLFKYLKPYRGLFALSLIFVLGSSLTTLAFPFVIGQLVDSALPAQLSQSIPPQATEWLSQFKADFFSLDNINGIAALLVLTLCLQTVFSYFRVLWFIQIGEKTLADLRRDLYSHLILLPMGFFVNRRVGELASRISSDISLIQDTFTTTLAEFLRSILNMLVGVTLIFWISSELSLVMISVFPVLILAALFFGRYIRKLSKEAQDRLADSGVVVEETLQGIQNVKAFSNEVFEVQRYRTAIDSLVRVVLKSAKYRGAFVSFLIFALFGSIVFMLWYGAGLVQTGDITVGELTSFLIYTTFIGAAFAGFGDQYGQVQKAIGATERVRELLQETPEAIDATRQNVPHLPVTGQLQFQKVDFTYPSRLDVPVLKGVNFVIEAGQKVAVVGPSGAGKSTLVSLLFRFYEPTGGQILLDGKPLSAYDLQGLRRRMALVPQDVFLFGGTIRENIAYGSIGADDAAIEQAARRANAHEFVTGFPEAYQTVVGERGVKLSGGQKQRIAIARALLRDPALLILDEATSSLDSGSEAVVQEALEELMRGRTTLIIAHRLATVRSADRIVVLDKGRVVESGTHDELMQHGGGLYQSLARLQFQAENLAPDASGTLHS